MSTALVVRSGRGAGPSEGYPVIRNFDSLI
jgi:hypothetical protein